MHTFLALPQCLLALGGMLALVLMGALVMGAVHSNLFQGGLGVALALRGAGEWTRARGAWSRGD